MILRLEELAKEHGRAAPGRPRVLVLAPTAELAQQVRLPVRSGLVDRCASVCTPTLDAYGHWLCGDMMKVSEVSEYCTYLCAQSTSASMVSSAFVLVATSYLRFLLSLLCALAWVWDLRCTESLSACLERSRSARAASRGGLAVPSRHRPSSCR